jgi:hypothetical protein
MRHGGSVVTHHEVWERVGGMADHLHDFVANAVVSHSQRLTQCREQQTLRSQMSIRVETSSLTQGKARTWHVVIPLNVSK